MRIVIVGTGYVGLVTGTCFSEMGLDVTCVDVDTNKIEDLKKGKSPIYEPGLEELIHKNLEAGRLHFLVSLDDCLEGADAVFLAVGTPPDEDGSADITHVLKVAGEIGSAMNKYLLVVNKSTVPPGTAFKVEDEIRKQLKKRKAEIEFDVASNPEFLKEGSAIKDFMYPDRVIIGTKSEKALDILNRIYRPFMLNNYRVINMDIISAEMTKYAANAMLATRISFMNEMANICEIIGADINMIRKGIGSDPRIGSKFLYPGVGYGGSCFPKDVKALIKLGKSKGKNLRILEAVEAVNNDQKKILFDKLMDHYKGNIKGLKIAIWGLSFKPETDDIREAPALALIDLINNSEGLAAVYDPVALNERNKSNISAAFPKDMYEACIDADALLLVTEWKEFRIPSWAAVKKIMRQPVIFDGRNIYDRNEISEYGFTYYNI